MTHDPGVPDVVRRADPAMNADGGEKFASAHHVSRARAQQRDSSVGAEHAQRMGLST